jgi:hypothetical protein
MCVTFSLRSSGRISSKSAFYSSLTKSSSAIFIFQMTNDAINLRPILVEEILPEERNEKVTHIRKEYFQ